MQEQDEKIIIQDMARLEWSCRRGMLELDVLLGNFLKEAYSGLSSEDKQQFEALLTCSDPQLFDWLIGSDIPSEKGLVHITEIIRHHARSRI